MKINTRITAVASGTCYFGFEVFQLIFIQFEELKLDRVIVIKNVLQKWKQTITEGRNIGIYTSEGIMHYRVERFVVLLINTEKNMFTHASLSIN
jgi:hypothetical protein